MSIWLTSRLASLGVGFAVALGVALGIRAATLGVAAEGVLGIPLGPDRAFWDYRTPTSLVERRQFVVAVSGQVSDVLNREYCTGREDRGYAIGVGGGAIAPWEYGTSGIWALGSGQAQNWTNPTGLYSLTPSPKIGLMAVSHAWGKGPWAVGATIYRTSFSLSDTFVFERFPTSSDSRVNAYLFDLLPDAIGKSIAYDALGNRIAFYTDAIRTTRFGSFGIVLSAWTAGADWFTQHTNSITDTRYNRHYLAGPKAGDGHGGWHGTGVEGRWGKRIGDRLDMEFRAGRGAWSGDANMWLRNPARAVSDDGEFVYDLEPSDWGRDSVSSDSWQFSFRSEWTYSVGTAIGANMTWENHDLTTAGFVRTPVLTLVGAGNGVDRVEQAAFFGLNGSLDVLGVAVFFSHHPRSGRWEWDGSVGLVQFDGWADTDAIPVTKGFTSSPSHQSWVWQRLRLALAEVSATRQMTQQIALTYSFRQYLPISGSWRRNGEPAAAPGGVSGIKLGSMHQVTVAMRL